MKNFQFLNIFQTIKLWCQVHIQVTSLLRKISIGMFKKKSSFFRVWLYQKQLGSLKGTSHSPRCCWHVRSLFSFCVCMLISTFILCLYDWGGWRGMRQTKLDMNTSVSLTKRKLCECICTKFKLTRVKLIFIKLLLTFV